MAEEVKIDRPKLGVSQQYTNQLRWYKGKLQQAVYIVDYDDEKNNKRVWRTVPTEPDDDTGKPD